MGDGRTLQHVPAKPTIHVDPRHMLEGDARALVRPTGLPAPTPIHIITHVTNVHTCCFPSLCLPLFPSSARCFFFLCPLSFEQIHRTHTQNTHLVYPSILAPHSPTLQLTHATR